MIPVNYESDIFFMLCRVELLGTKLRVPDGMPAAVVVLSVKGGERLGQEYFWSPAFSGVDGSLVTNDEFIPFE